MYCTFICTAIKEGGEIPPFFPILDPQMFQWNWYNISNIGKTTSRLHELRQAYTQPTCLFCLS